MASSLEIHNEYDYIGVAELKDIPENGRLFIQLGTKAIAVFRISGNYFAIEDTCTHDDGSLGEGLIEGEQIICPRHGARFDLRTGKALTLPAVQDIQIYPVQIAGTELQIGIKRNNNFA